MGLKIKSFTIKICTTCSLICAVAVIIAGCAQETAIQDSFNISQIIIAGNADASMLTKTCIEANINNNTSYVSVLWTPNDELGVFTNNEKNVKYNKYNQEQNEVVAQFVTTENVTGTPLCAYYPYNESAGTDLSSLSGSIPEIQTMDPAKGTLPGDFKRGEFKKTTANGVEFRFTHLFSPVRILINGSDTNVSGDNLMGIDLTVSRNGVAVPLCGNFTFDCQTGEYTLNQTATNVTFDWTTKPALNGQSQAFGTIFPTIKKGDDMTFVIRTTANTATVTVKAKVDFKANTIYTFPLTLSNLKDNTVFENEDDSGDTGGSTGTDMHFVSKGTFKAVTYNVDGLPKKVSLVTINDDGPGADGTTNISSKIAEQNWDFIGFSEDFEYNNELKSKLTNYTWGTHRGSVSTDALYKTLDTDGLQFAARTSSCSFGKTETWTAFTSSYGGLTSGANTCIQKGIRHYVITLADNTAIDVIITHMNTYSSSGSSHINAQHAQLKQIAQYINNLVATNNRPVIFMGDTNCRYTRHDFKTYFWNVLDENLTYSDPWVDFQWGGVYPTYPSNSLMVGDATGTSSSDIICEGHQKGEVVDKIIYINNPSAPIQIRAKSYLRDYDNFNGMADHMPIVVEFEYGTMQPVASGTAVGVDSWDEELDLL